MRGLVASLILSIFFVGVVQTHCHASRLTNFAIISNAVEIPPLTKDGDGLREVLSLLRTNHLRKHLFRDPRWRAMEEEYLSQTNDRAKAVSELFAFLEDRHAKYHSVERMSKVVEGVQAVQFEWGLRLRRRLYLSETWAALKFSAKTAFDWSLQALKQPISSISLLLISASLFYFRPKSKSLATFLFYPLAVFLAVLASLAAWLTATIICATEIADMDNPCSLHVGDRLLRLENYISPFVPVYVLNALLQSADSEEETANICVLRKESEQNANHSYSLISCRLSAGYHHSSSMQRNVFKQGLGYIKIDEFNDFSFEDFCDAFESLKEDSMRLGHSDLKGLVIDLRGNGGGSLDTALDTAALFLKKWTVLIKLSDSLAYKNVCSVNGFPDLDTSLLLLIDERTASASEALVESLCANGRAISFGGKTFGKNTAQALLMLSDDSGLCFTIKEFRGPYGRSLDGGILPTVFLEPKQIDVSKLSFNPWTKEWSYDSQTLMRK